MKLRYRLIFLTLFLLSLIAIGRFVTGDFLFVLEDFWFAAGLLLLVLISLIDQPFFSTDANIFMNGASGLSLILVEPNNRDMWWVLFLIWSIWLLVSSYILLWITAYNPIMDSPIRRLLSRINRELGKPEVMFSAYFIWGAINQFGYRSKEIQPLFIFWSVFIVLNFPSVSTAINQYFEDLFGENKDQNGIGKIYKVSDPRVIESSIFIDAPTKLVGKSIVISDNQSQIAEGIIIDDRTIVGDRIAKIALTNISDHWQMISEKPERFTITLDEQVQNNLDQIPIGVVDSGSTISTLKFHVHPDTKLMKGDVIFTLTSEGIRIYYQVTLAEIVENRQIEGNITKTILVTANQLGLWDNEKVIFDQYPWVPASGTLINKVTFDFDVNTEIPITSTQIGIVPNSPFPVHVKVNELVTHNSAIIGVTGSGKSYLAFHLIESMIERNIKVLILDLTREHFEFLSSHNPTPLVRAENVNTWYDDENSLIGIHQFANTASFPLTTKQFVNAAFDKVRAEADLQPGVSIPGKLCVVFEEAHSLVPEWNQVADRNDTSHVNETARTILQGRKYGMGSMLITQRTANVTKSILNQCNTLFALRAFDQTGIDFLSNYMGNEYAHGISTLPTQNAILVGKSSSCQTPVILSITDFSDRWIGEQQEVGNQE